MNLIRKNVSTQWDNKQRMQKIKLPKKWPIFLVICVAIFFVVLPLLKFRTRSVPDNPRAVEAVAAYTPNINVLEKHGLGSRWIVITSINDMTPSIQQMATFSAYHIVVVMDAASPTVRHAEENIVYLTVEEQRKLGFNIFKHVPLNSYTRKNIGYLYAIQNGARMIYDTDDDNFIEFPPRERDTRMDELVPCVRTDRPIAVNPYAAFGKPEIWPRGFPLEKIALECTGRGSRRSGNALPLTNASIWQGLADLDPDVDAVFRMTHTEKLKRVVFTRRPPVYIPHDTFAPFNSQNTQFFYDSFWALYLPSSVSFRVTDIWRGYFVQKLIRYTGSYVAFVGPTVEQFRNAHNYAADYASERQMYDQTAALLHFLDTWEPNDRHARFFEIMASLAQDMAAEGFWENTDVLAIRAWIADLRRLDYAEPVVTWNDAHRNHAVRRPAHPFEVCGTPFNGENTLRRMNDWWTRTEQWPPATFAVQMDTRGFGAYVYDMVFSMSYFLQAGRSFAYNKNDRSAYDSSFCDTMRGPLCFFYAKSTDYAESELEECASNAVNDSMVCSVLRIANHYRGAIAGESRVQLATAEIVPREASEAGWDAMHWAGFLTQKMTRPNAKIDAEVRAAKSKMEWGENEECVAVHIRRSDKKIEYTKHTYPPTFLYVEEVRRILIENNNIASVYVTSDSGDALREFTQMCQYRIPEVRIMVSDQTRFNGKECGKKEGECKSRNNLSDPAERREWAVNSMVDYYLLSSCPYLVGSFSSFFTKAAAYNMVGSPSIARLHNAEDRFRSIDDDDALQTWEPQHTVQFELPLFTNVKVTNRIEVGKRLAEKDGLAN